MARHTRVRRWIWLHRFLARDQLPRKVIDLLCGVTDGSGGAIDPSRVVETFCRRHKVPRSLVDTEITIDLDELSDHFSARLLGQEQAVQAIVRMIGKIKAGLSDPRRPFGVFLFAGPTGVGKTYLAQLAADYLFGSPDRVVRINMADHQTPQSTNTLFGDPEENRLPQLRGLLTQRLMGQPFAVLLLDEFEKASREVHDRFLQLIDEGSFINGAGETISCRSMIVIATTNAGADVYRAQGLGFAGGSEAPTRDRELDRTLEQYFRFELLNRFDQVVHFHPLSRRDIRVIAQRELEEIEQRAGLRQRKITLEVEESVLDWLTAHGYDPDFGARFLRRTVERSATTALAEAVVRYNPKPGSQLRLGVRRDRVVAIQAATPQPAREHVVIPEGTGDRSLNLDKDALAAEANRLVEAADPLLQRLEAKRTRLRTLLERMNEPDFWNETEDRGSILEEFRRLDVSVRAEDRIARPITRIAESPAQDARHLANQVEKAAAALHEWDVRVAEESPAAVWLVLSSADPLRPAGEWLDDLVALELAWCRRLHLTSNVVAFEEVDGRAVRIALEVEGPGAAALLEMEQGVHRQTRQSGRDRRVVVDVIPQSEERAGSSEVKTRTVRQRRGPFRLVADQHAQIELDRRGVRIELLAGDRSTLVHLASDLMVAWSEVTIDEVPLARVYGEGGSGARDPRTGVVVARIKDVMKGRLDRFLEAWRRSESATQ